ncbi:uncharacterized protein H6S33_012240 [Morchella sextelata]|uniref:uncharacterized protein n=1 Tax=Morchella sextelata TaxID=1174677 RepID=UPI001D04E50F|nr:uncharacterized protein H6S33_012240 [Morchella sextelata]KAH0610713.1 hypothetical protein H6S33_012240 [Morchella sextelata]
MIVGSRRCIRCHPVIDRRTRPPPTTTSAPAITTTTPCMRILDDGNGHGSSCSTHSHGAGIVWRRFPGNLKILSNIPLLEGISMLEDKLEADKEWPIPENVKAVQAFLGFVNFYRRFIDGFSKVCKLLTDLLQKDKKWYWTAAHEQAFEELNRLFTSTPILLHFDPSRRTVVETDASDFVKGAFSPAEINYDIHHKEMGAIVASFWEWKHMFKSREQEITVFTHHKNLEYFNSTKVLTRRPGQLVLDPAKLVVVRVNQLQNTFLECLYAAVKEDSFWQELHRSLIERKSNLDQNLSVKNGLIFYKNRWYIPKDKKL